MDLGQCLKAIDQIAALQDDWDGTEADPLTLEVVEAARWYVQWTADSPSLIMPQKIVPSPDGNIILAWVEDGQVYYEIEFDDRGEMVIENARQG